MNKAIAKARKTKGVYKPIIKLGDRTEVVEQNPERFGTYTKRGYIQGNKYARGNTYENRQDAVDAAQKEIDRRLDIHLKEYNKRIEKYGIDDVTTIEYKPNVIIYGGQV